MAIDTQDGEHVPGGRIAYTAALIAELRLLVRAISNDADKTLTTLRMTYQIDDEARQETLTSDRILAAVSDIESSPAKQSELKSIAFLQAVRDALVAMTRPATGLSIAYTTLVAGGQRQSGAESSFQLASQAYGLLEWRAKLHRNLVWTLLLLGIAFTGLAGWEATKAALGKSLLQNMDILRTQQAAIMTEKLKLETSMDKPVGDDDLTVRTSSQSIIPLTWLPLCDRYRQRLMFAVSNNLQIPVLDKSGEPPRLANSPAERELCGRDTVVARNIAIVHQEMFDFLRSWPTMVGPPFAGFIRSQQTTPVADEICENTSETGPGTARPIAKFSCDLEFVIAPILQVTTNYLMPMLFGTLGSLLFVLVDHFTKLRMSTLNPKDLSLLPLRLILGVVIAACVSLLITSYAAPSSAPPGSAGK